MEGVGGWGGRRKAKGAERGTRGPSGASESTIEQGQQGCLPAQSGLCRRPRAIASQQRQQGQEGSTPTIPLPCCSHAAWHTCTLQPAEMRGPASGSACCLHCAPGRASVEGSDPPAHGVLLGPLQQSPLPPPPPAPPPSMRNPSRQAGTQAGISPRLLLDRQPQPPGSPRHYGRPHRPASRTRRWARGR